MVIKKSKFKEHPRGRWFECKLKDGNVMLLSQVEVEEDQVNYYPQIEEVRSELTNEEIDKWV